MLKNFGFQIAIDMHIFLLKKFKSLMMFLKLRFRRK